MTTTIISNGSRWAGQEPASMADLIDVLAMHPLDAQYAPFFHTSEATGATRFFGNFTTISHVFNIDTTDDDTITNLKSAIATNLKRPDYQPLPKKPKKDSDDKDQPILI